jgi:hypothetical protein
MMATNRIVPAAAAGVATLVFASLAFGAGTRTPGAPLLLRWEPERPARDACVSCGAEATPPAQARRGRYAGEVICDELWQLGARTGTPGGAIEIFISSTVADLVVGSGMTFHERGEHELSDPPPALSRSAQLL